MDSKNRKVHLPSWGNQQFRHTFSNLDPEPSNHWHKTVDDDKTEWKIAREIFRNRSTVWTFVANDLSSCLQSLGSKNDKEIAAWHELRCFSCLKSDRRAAAVGGTRNRRIARSTHCLPHLGTWLSLSRCLPVKFIIVSLNRPHIYHHPTYVTLMSEQIWESRHIVSDLTTKFEFDWLARSRRKDFRFLRIQVYLRVAVAVNVSRRSCENIVKLAKVDFFQLKVVQVDFKVFEKAGLGRICCCCLKLGHKQLAQLFNASFRLHTKDKTKTALKVTQCRMLWTSLSYQWIEIQQKVNN